VSPDTPSLAPDPILACEIQARGGLEPAIQALAADESPLLPRLLAHLSTLDEAADPALLARRLHQRARDLDARAEPLWLEAAQDAGLAAARRLRGELALAETFERRAVAAEALAAEFEADAFALRLQAAQIEASQNRRRDLARALEGLAA